MMIDGLMIRHIYTYTGIRVQAMADNGWSKAKAGPRVGARVLAKGSQKADQAD